jgi:hypothetical protein
VPKFICGIIDTPEASWIVIICVAVGAHEYLNTLISELIQRCVQSAKGRSLLAKEIGETVATHEREFLVAHIEKFK